MQKNALKRLKNASNSGVFKKNQSLEKIFQKIFVDPKILSLSLPPQNARQRS